MLVLLCSSAKIERDRGVIELQRQLENPTPLFVRELEVAIQRILSDASAPWESKHGSLMGATALVLDEGKQGSEEFIKKTQSFGISLLEDGEQRVRFQAGDHIYLLK